MPSNWQTEFVGVWRAEDGTVMQPIGRQIDLQGAPRFDTSSANVATFLFGTHTLSTNWSAWHVWSVADGAELRTFAMSAAYDEPLAFLSGGNGLLTRAGTGLAAWCR